MKIIEDIKSLYRKLTKSDLYDRIAFDELGYGRRVGDCIYAFCPFCGKILEFDADQIEKEEPGAPIRLKSPVSCDCREGLRYLRKGLLDNLSEYPPADMKFRTICGGICLAVTALCVFGFRSAIHYNEVVGFEYDIQGYLTDFGGGDGRFDGFGGWGGFGGGDE